MAEGLVPCTPRIMGPGRAYKGFYSIRAPTVRLATTGAGE